MKKPFWAYAGSSRSPDSVNGRTFTNLDAFAPESAWNEDGQASCDKDAAAG